MLTFRYAEASDMELYYNWASDVEVRQNSFNPDRISWEDHVKWFNAKIADKNSFMYLFLHSGVPAGQVRVELNNNEHIIGISVDKKFRGKGLSSKMVEMACEDYFTKNSVKIIVAYVKKNNYPSVKLFHRAGFSDDGEVICHGQESLRLSIKSQRN